MRVLLLFLWLVKPSFQGDLFTILDDFDNGDVKACQGDDIISCEVGIVNVEAFKDDILELPDGFDLYKKNDIAKEQSRSGMAGQANSVAYTDGEIEAVFSYRQGKVIGNIAYPDGSDIVIEPCRNFEGCHVWKEEDAENFEDGEGIEPPKIPGIRNALSERSANDLRQQGIDDNTTIVEYSVKFYYTIDFAEVTDDIELYLDQITAQTNQGFIDSNIPVRMKIHCIEGTKLKDKQNGVKMLNVFAAYKDTHEELRGSADAAALLIKDFAYCGIGYIDTWRSGHTITVQTKGCALASFTLGHELGHNFGCVHDNQHSSEAPYPYAYGAYIVEPFRTIMAYSKTGYPTRANVYSSPNVQYNGATTGSELEDNARVIKENRFGMAAVGDESGTCDWNFGGTTQAPGTTTEGPSVTTETPVTLKCMHKGERYAGVNLGKAKRVKSEKTCQKRCLKKKKCDNYTYYTEDYAKKKLRKKCQLRKSFSGSETIEGAISGSKAACL